MNDFSLIMFLARARKIDLYFVADGTDFLKVTFTPNDFSLSGYAKVNVRVSYRVNTLSLFFYVQL